MNRKRIAFLNFPHGFTPIIRGTNLAKNGHEVYFFSPNGFYYSPSKYKSIKCIKINWNGIEYYNNKSLCTNSNDSINIKLIEYIIKIFPEFLRWRLHKYYNIFLKSIVENIKILLKYYQVFRLSKTIRLDILHIVDMFSYCQYSIISGSKKIVLEPAGSDLLVHPISKPILKTIYRFCFKFADAVVQDGPSLQNAGLKYGAPQKHNKVISLGVRDDIFNLDVKKGVAKAKLHIGKNIKVILSPRGINKVYNLDIIIKSIPLVVSSVPNVIYVFCSSMSSSKSIDFLKNLCVELDISKYVKFLDPIDWDTELKFFYKDSDLILSVPSSDSFPISVLEAMACGVPVIATQLPWYKNTFIPGKDFLTVPIRNYIKLADETINILNNKTKIDTEYVSKKVINQLSSINESNRLEVLYEQILYT